MPQEAPVRYGSVINLRSEHAEAYEELHRNVWPDVLATLKAGNISNYSIFRRGELLFGYFEYTGDDYESDMATVAAAPATQRWWEICKPCQEQMHDTPPAEWWAPMQEVFHLD